MVIASFAKTGNIEVVRNGKRELLGQYADNSFILNIDRVSSIGDRAYARINECATIVQSYGKPKPNFIWQ